MADAGGSSGVWVYDLGAGGGLLYSENASNDRIPASNQKLFTTSAFLDELGADATLETRVYSRGKLGGPGDSVLSGDIVIRGDGDPSFGTAKFARQANQPATRVANLAGDIARAGIERITRPDPRRRHDLRPRAPRRPLPEPALGALVQRRLRRRTASTRGRPSCSPPRGSRTRSESAGSR